MKKIISIFLCMVLLAGCSAGASAGTTEGTQPQKEQTLQVGYARADITPTESIPLSGFQNYHTRLSDGVTERLYATCIAFRDTDSNTVLMFTLDLGQCYSNVTSLIRVAIAKETGIPVNHVLAAATHNHSSPFLDTGEFDSIIRYNASLKKQMIQAAKGCGGRSEACENVHHVCLSGESEFCQIL